jgi:hypothetical protein
MERDLLEEMEFGLLDLLQAPSHVAMSCRGMVNETVRPKQRKDAKACPQDNRRWATIFLRGLQGSFCRLSVMVAIPLDTPESDAESEDDEWTTGDAVGKVLALIKQVYLYRVGMR